MTVRRSRLLSQVRINLVLCRCLPFTPNASFIFSYGAYRRMPRNKLNPLGKYGCLDSCDMVGLDFGSGCKHCFTISLTSSSGMAPNTSSPGL